MTVKYTRKTVMVRGTTADAAPARYENTSLLGIKMSSPTNTTASAVGICRVNQAGMLMGKRICRINQADLLVGTRYCFYCLAWYYTTIVTKL